jgi:hypothetical protein
MDEREALTRILEMAMNYLADSDSEYNTSSEADYDRVAMLVVSKMIDEMEKEG